MTMRRASSHQKSSSWDSRPRLAPQEATKATVMRHADEQHHPGPAGPDLADRAGEEGTAAPRVHDGAEHRRDGAEAGDPRQRVADDGGEHAAEQHRRHSQGEHDPEQPAEHRDVVAVAAVRPVPLGPVVAGAPLADALTLDA